mmetsp:Transcript_9810/g.20287  ORF Transcript_9810/g.20287 Transcript_9810/m.20287 type:complete len:110 (+) Transcript_9810:39-368(+)|eukprot:CAMPEP_0185905000 /NCGR_PEP_ID=MMETSP0196C-20130402/4247_1 /TAXON_ID=2932 /ORGANISM="Alexandrium fundyense, Strain CCMP1719" /LENGTH=109 /DNA_ID=CAMNT_0028624435 /DNA_START=93 /DNA_END=422 /DNA_ORIENTATION=+
MAPGMQAHGPISKDDPRFRKFESPTLYDGVESVKVDLGDEDASDEEEVFIDRVLGPLLWRPGLAPMGEKMESAGATHQVKDWKGMSVTEQTCIIQTVAKKNRALKRFHS